jgi:putative peptide zinc metalloprotease protein
MESAEYVRVINDAPGYVKAVLVDSGRAVSAQDPLLKLSDRELDLEIEATVAQRDETLAMELRALHMEKADLRPIRKRLQTVEARLKELNLQRDSLVVKARKSGIWVSPQAKEMIGSWLARGSAIGEIVDHGAFRFSAVVSQDEAANLFAGRIKKAEIRLYGQGGQNIDVIDYKIIPFQHEKLPSAALGWAGGGEVPVAVTDEMGLQAAEPFFQIYASVQSSAKVLLLHGRSGKLRFTLNPKPLLFQWEQKLRQLLQKRYQI